MRFLIWGLALALIAGAGLGGWVGFTRVSETAADRLRAETLATASRLAGGVTITPTIVMQLLCGSTETQQTVAVARPEEITGALISQAVPEGCHLRAASFVLQAKGEVPETVAIRADGVDAVGSVTFDQSPPEMQVQVEAKGQAGLFRQEVTASASAPVPTEAVRGETERRLQAALLEATPVIVEREAGVTSETVTVAEQPLPEQDATLEQQSATAEQHDSTAERADGSTASPTVIMVNGVPFDFSKPPELPPDMSPTPDQSWFNEEFFKGFTTGPNGTLEEFAEAARRNTRPRPPGR